MNTNYNILDAYRQIIKNPLLNDFDMVKIALKEIQKKIKILNLFIIYLRKIHGFCFYCLKGFKDERSLKKKYCYIHLRHYIQLGKRENSENININELNITENNAKEFDKYFNNKLNELLNDKEKINEYILLRPKYLMDDEFALAKIKEEENIFLKIKSVVNLL